MISLYRKTEVSFLTNVLVEQYFSNIFSRRFARNIKISKHFFIPNDGNIRERLWSGFEPI